MRIPPRRFAPGFRFSTLDAMVLVGGGVVASMAARVDFWIGVAIGFVVAHFFLFCNVLRMSRSLELIWAGSFAGLALAATVSILSWPSSFAFLTGVTLLLAAIEIRKPSYHGVGWRRLNPRLPEWWNARGGDCATGPSR